MFKWLILILLLLFIYHVREVFPPFIVGAIFAYLLYPLVRFFNQRVGLAPFWSVLLIYTGTGLIVGLLAYHGWPILGNQATKLFEQREELVGKIVSQASSAFGWQVDVPATTAILLDQIQHGIGKPEEIAHLAGGTMKALLNFLVCAITSIYMLVDHKRVGRFFTRFIPIEKRATVVSLMGQMDVMFRRYVWGQLGLITLMSTIAFVILSSFGIHYALLIALVSGVLEIIPVLGPLLAILIASAFAIAQLGLPNAAWIPLCYWIARLVEDYIVVPNTIGHAVELHPLAVIFAVVVGETMAGALGMLIAIPVAASIKVVIDFCYPPATVGANHHKQKHPLSWMVEMFKRQEATQDPVQQQALLDAQAIALMHSGTSATGELAGTPASISPQTTSNTTEPKVAPTNPIPTPGAEGTSPSTSSAAQSPAFPAAPLAPVGQPDTTASATSQTGKPTTPSVTTSPASGNPPTAASEKPIEHADKSPAPARDTKSGATVEKPTAKNAPTTPKPAAEPQKSERQNAPEGKELKRDSNEDNGGAPRSK